MSQIKLLMLMFAVFGTGCIHARSDNPNPVLHLAFDEIANKKIIDSSGRDNACVINGMPGWTQGVNGFALEFSRTGDTIGCASRPHFHPAGQIAQRVALHSFQTGIVGGPVCA